MLDVKRRLKVLMVYPLIPEAFWGFGEALRAMGKRATMTPTCLATVAAMLSEKYFKLFPIIDLNVEPLLDKQILEVDVVMLSAMIVQQDSLRQTIARVKRLGKTVVVGGPFATSYTDEVLAMGVDYVVAGEAELTLAPFIEDFLAGRAQRVYDEVSTRGRSLTPLTPKGKPVMTKTPIPRWDLLKLNKYGSVALQFSRGCKFNCEFCDIVVLNGHESRAKAAEQMLAEVEAIYQIGWRGSVFIVDDNFITNLSAAVEFLRLLIPWNKKRGYPLSFFTEASLDLADDEKRFVIDLMAQAGFTDVFVGVETPDTKALRSMHKGQNRGDLAAKVRTIQAAGIEVLAGFIVGSDGDKETIFEAMFDFIQDNGIVIPMVGLLTALRRTDLHKRLVREGRLRADTSGNNTHHFGFNFETKLDERFLVEGYVDSLGKLFSSKNYFARCRTLRARRGRYRRTNRLNRPGILAAMRIGFHYLVRHPNRECAKFLLETLWQSPREFGEAMTQVVKFRHFDAITEAALSAYYYPERVATLAERFQAQVAELRGDVRKRLSQLAKLEKRFMTEATRLYHAIPRDFRASVRETFEQRCWEFGDWINRQREVLLGLHLATGN